MICTISIDAEKALGKSQHPFTIKAHRSPNWLFLAPVKLGNQAELWIFLTFICNKPLTEFVKAVIQNKYLISSFYKIMCNFFLMEGYTLKLTLVFLER